MSFTRSGLVATVRAEMARRGLSQATASERIGISRAALSHRLMGRTPFTLAETSALADLFGMSLAELVAQAEPVPA